jgi:hypothetical protein
MFAILADEAAAVAAQLRTVLLGADCAGIMFSLHLNQLTAGNGFCHSNCP